MLYVIEKDGKFFSGGGSPVTLVAWVNRAANALGTTSLESAKAIAERYGGKPVPFEG